MGSDPSISLLILLVIVILRIDSHFVIKKDRS